MVSAHVDAMGDKKNEDCQQNFSCKNNQHLCKHLVYAFVIIKYPNNHYHGNHRYYCQ